MNQFSSGHVHVDLADGVTLDPRAGTLDDHQVRQLEKAHAEADKVGALTAQAMKDHNLAVSGVTADELAKKAAAVGSLGNTVADLEVTLKTMKQFQLILEDALHKDLRRVNAAVHADEKFDASVATAFPALKEYFAQNHKKTGT